MTTTASNAIAQLFNGCKIFIHTACAAPQELIRHLYTRHNDLRDVEIYQLHTEGEAPYANPECDAAFTVKAMFVGGNIRKAVHEGRASYIPIFLSEASRLFRSRTIQLDFALVSVSPPDKHGFCSLGPSVDISLAAIESAKVVIAQVNKFIPRTHGDGMIHVRNINHFVEYDEALPEVEVAPVNEVQLAIGRNIASMIENGSTLQMGIGAIPNAVLSCLENHKNLGIHTEMFSDGILPLVEKGVINGRKKKKHPGMIVSSFVVGSRKVFDFIDDNPLVKMLASEYVNKPDVISKNPKVIAINSAIEIDLTGQVCADSIGSKIYSGVGGQMDFIRGASLSKGGKPIIALPSLTNKGISRIVPVLKSGAGVVTTRAHIHYVVTEYGIANLYGKSIHERLRELIRIAHPEHREQLEKSARELVL